MGAALVLAALPLVTRAAGDPAIFDFTRAHEFLGFGTQVWMNQKDTSEGQQLLRELNARFVRVSMIPKLPFEQLRPGLDVNQALALIDAHDSAEQRTRFAAFARDMRALGIRPVLIFWRMPDPWTQVHKRKAGSKSEARLADPARVADYANLVTAMLLYARRHGVEPAAVELTNEPQGAWDTRFEREDYASLVLKARSAMDRHGLQDWRIAGPGTGIRNFDHFVGGLQAMGATGALGYISAHVYQSPAQLAQPDTPGVASFLGRGRFGPILITEFGVKKHNADDEDADNDLDVRTPAYGLAAAAEAVMLMAHGAGGLIYWQLQDFSWSKKPHGLLGEDGRRRPVAQAFQTLFGRLEPGLKVVGAQRANAKLPSVALQGPGRSVLLVVNLSAQAQAWEARLQGGHGGCQRLADIGVWREQGEPRQGLRDLTVRDCTVRAEVQPGTVAAVVLQ